MSTHNVETELEAADMNSELSFFDTPEGRTFGAGKTVGNGIQGWAPNATFVHTDGGAGAGNYRNTGSKTTATWTLAHAYLSGESVYWSPAAVFTSRMLGGGTALSNLRSTTASMKFIEFRCYTSAASGDNRLAYFRYTLAGAGGGECMRASTVVIANLGTAHGAHFGIEFLATAGASECSGLGVGLRGTLMIPNVASWAPTGTYAAGMFEIFSEGTNSDPAGMTELSVLRLVNGGHATGAQDVDTDANILSIQGFSPAGNTTSAITSTHLAEMPGSTSVGLRVKIGASFYYIPCVPTGDWD